MNFATIMPLFIGGMRGWQFIVIVLLIVLLFGAKRIPSLMRSLGKSVHSFKQGMAEAEEEMKKPVRTERDTKDNETKAKDID